MRLSIEVTANQHKKLKAAAALQGKSIKDYVLDRTLPDQNEEAALKDLEAFLEPRLEAAKRGEWCDQTVGEIVNEVLQEEQTQ
ncbi:MAG: DUF1778 domain-containing protein [Gammaproteobacteria bacterium]|nr:DUF1778 domain-containing protein [Gammaproteobacteria bacterium]